MKESLGSSAWDELEGFTKSKKSAAYFYIMRCGTFIRGALGICTRVFLFNYLIITLLVISAQFVHSEGGYFCRCSAGLCLCACG